MSYDGIVIGGGAAGMFAAITAARRGHAHALQFSLYVFRYPIAKSTWFLASFP